MNTTMFDIKSKIKQIKNTVLQMTPLEIKVRECTSNDSWGVKLSDKLEVADHSFNYEDFKLIFSVIRIRLADVGKDWRHVQKGIQLVEFLVINGSERCLDEARDMQSLIRQMKNFKYVDDDGKDWGVNVRDAAKHFLEFIKDEEKIKEEREIAKQQKEKYEGFSRSEAKHKSRTTGSSSSEKKKKEKKPSYDDEYDAPKKSTSRSSFEEEEYEQEEKPRASSPVNQSGRPRKPSTGTTPSFQTTSQPVKQKEDTLIDFFDTPVTTTTNQYNNNNFGNNNGFGNNGLANNSGWSQPTQPVNTGFNPRTASTQPTNSGFNPRGNNGASFNTGGNDFEANFDSSGFDDGFGTNDAFNNASGQEKKDSTLFDISSGLVNLDLNETKQQTTSQPVNPSQPSANMSLKELKRLQGNNTPTKPPVMNNTTPSFPSNTSFPPNNNFGGGYPNNNGFNNYPPNNNNNFGGYPNNNMPPRTGGNYPPNNNFGNMPQPSGYGYNNQPVNNNRPPQNNNNNGGGFDFF
ncbi:predicted protein [Naegleria gruberi]|uniref:Predicted protein n=1 Tax=Naegleria gruberi TaxID=5762 RepID=D2VKP7_NAEGR|nr:uncharacterized protein NAEGRDRAFT_58510 [Naegleria gruberi]EFC42631.1 predicted protein [Naegleria gruberi]|eukprot:XP_002675375.1 predicted protein [Naegleria gruberi strain NEG-M]